MNVLLSVGTQRVFVRGKAVKLKRLILEIRNLQLAAIWRRLESSINTMVTLSGVILTTSFL